MKKVRNTKEFRLKIYKSALEMLETSGAVCICWAICYVICDKLHIKRTPYARIMADNDLLNITPFASDIYTGNTKLDSLKNYPELYNIRPDRAYECNYWFDTFDINSRIEFMIPVIKQMENEIDQSHTPKLE